MALTGKILIQRGQQDSIGDIGGIFPIHGCRQHRLECRGEAGCRLCSHLF